MPKFPKFSQNELSTKNTYPCNFQPPICIQIQKSNIQSIRLSELHKTMSKRKSSTKTMNKINLTAIATIAILAGGIASAKTIVAGKNYTTKKVQTTRFNGISTSDAIDVIYTPSASGSQHVEIYAPGNVIDYIDVKVDQGVLTVSTTASIKFWGKVAPQVRVSAPAVNSLRTSSSGDIKIKSPLNTKGNLTITTSGSGDVTGGNVSASGNVTIKTSSSGDVKLLSLSCKQLSANASSSGDVKLVNTTCTDLNAKASSCADIKIKCIKATNVYADASSSGDIEISGTCVNAILSASSSGDIKCRSLKAKNVTKSQRSSGTVICGNR